MLRHWHVETCRDTSAVVSETGSCMLCLSSTCCLFPTCSFLGIARLAAEVESATVPSSWGFLWKLRVWIGRRAIDVFYINYCMENLHSDYDDDLSCMICYPEMRLPSYSMAFWLDWRSLWLRWFWLSDLVQGDAFVWEFATRSIWKLLRKALESNAIYRWIENPAGSTRTDIDLNSAIEFLNILS